jgi:AAA family ATP:ADP antiporter
MSIGEQIVCVFQRVCHWNFGDFEKEEFKKFLRLGLIFSVIIGVYWTMRPLKDAVFIHLVDRLQLPFAKTVSLIGMLPLVMMYTKLIEKNSKEKMFVVVPTIYGLSLICFGLVMSVAQAPAEIIAARSNISFLATKALGYLFYLFVESFGSLVTAALFWSFASDTTDPVSAKRGFPFVYALGQLGGIICPYSIGGLPHRLNLSTDALSIILLGVLVLLIIPLVKYFLKATPGYLLSSFEGKNELADSPKEEGFFEGLKLLLRHRYLMAIFAVNFIYEVVVTIFDFNFKVAAGAHYSGVELSNYLSIYGSSTL